MFWEVRVYQDERWLSVLRTPSEDKARAKFEKEKEDNPISVQLVYVVAVWNGSTSCSGK